MARHVGVRRGRVAVQVTAGEPYGELESVSDFLADARRRVDALFDDLSVLAG